MAVRAKWMWAVAGAVFALGLFAVAAIYLGSEALIVRRYTLPSSIVHAAAAPADLAWGRHVATIYGCADCHGADLSGRMMTVPPGLRVEAPSLRSFAAERSDADFDRAVRHGLAPSARALWVMPSQAYVYMRDSDLADIIGYLRAHPPARADAPPAETTPDFSFAARFAVLDGSLAPVNPYDLGRHPPRDVGPRYDGGRYLAAMACSSCHGTDLGGTAAAPDLGIAAKYSRIQFFELMHSGRTASGRPAPEMERLAGTRFDAFRDYEIDALYAYLVQRARAPSGP